MAVHMLDSWHALDAILSRGIGLASTLLSPTDFSTQSTALRHSTSTTTVSESSMDVLVSLSMWSNSDGCKKVVSGAEKGNIQVSLVNNEASSGKPISDVALVHNESSIISTSLAVSYIALVSNESACTSSKRGHSKDTGMGSPPKKMQQQEVGHGRHHTKQDCPAKGCKVNSSTIKRHVYANHLPSFLQEKPLDVDDLDYKAKIAAFLGVHDVHEFFSLVKSKNWLPEAILVNTPGEIRL